MTARDVAWGRRGGRWCEQAPGELADHLAERHRLAELEATEAAAELERTGEQLGLFGDAS